MKESDKVSFGEFIKQCRLERGMTQDDVAYRMGVNQPWISKIEKGEHDQFTTTVLRLMDAMEIPRSEFYKYLDN